MARLIPEITKVILVVRRNSNKAISVKRAGSVEAAGQFGRRVLDHFLDHFRIADGPARM
jgi:hypothetical protein